MLLAIFYCQFATAQTMLKPGTWRGITKTEKRVEIPFNFETATIDGKTVLTIINGDERIKVTEIVYKKGDSVIIKMPLYDSEFRLKQKNGWLFGHWIKNLGTKYVAMDFLAVPDTKWRFKAADKPVYDLTGRWAAPFSKEGDTTLNVGEFRQTGSKLTGTFLSATGDYRYLEGVVNGNKLYLSTFDGGNNYLFTATIAGNNKITNGKFYAGLTSVKEWSALKDAKAALPDSYSLTGLKPGYTKLSFTFKDLNGKDVSLTDAPFKNRVVIVQLLGSWCPNCMDETAYMVNFYKRYKAKGVEIVGLAYERTTDFSQSKRTVTQIKNKLNVSYPLLLTGYTPAKGEPAKSLPMLQKVLGFPTTIIVDRNGNVRKIHTGFSGPGTGKHYTDFIMEFERLVIQLLK